MNAPTGRVRNRIIAWLGLASALLWPALAWSQDYPTRAIQFIVPTTAGTTGDQLARLLGAKLSQRWRVPVVVDNKVGAGGAIGFDAAAKANPDGYSFLFSATALGSLSALTPKLPYDPLKDFASVVQLGTSPLVLVVTNSVPAKDAAEFVAYVKKQPRGRLNYASPGVGSIHHLSMEMFKQESGISLTHIPYKGTTGALNDLVAGHVEAGFVVLQTAAPLVRSGKLRLLSVAAQERAPLFPQVPTLVEAGFNNMVMGAWLGVSAPAGTPTALLEKMNSELNALLLLPEVKESMSKMGVDAVGGKPETLDALLRSDIKTWGQVVKNGNIKAE